MDSQADGKAVTTDPDPVPVMEIIDPYGYVTSTRVIVRFIIKSPNGEQIRVLKRTSKNGYMMQ